MEHEEKNQFNGLILTAANFQELAPNGKCKSHYQTASEQNDAAHEERRAFARGL